MSDLIPLGMKEDFHLEFKAQAALGTPEDIAREVVAMLNAEGGEVWIGLREEGGRAVAIDPIPDPDREETQLRDYLIDKIEPSPSVKEVKILRAETTEGILFRLKLTPAGNHKPYALLKKGGGRHYIIRIGERLRPMTREELIFSFKEGGGKKDKVEQASTRLLEIRGGALAQHRSLLWLGIRPVSDLELDLQDPALEKYLQEPELTGNRQMGWNFCKFNYRPRLQKEKLVTRPEELRAVEFWKDGTLLFQVPLESLFWKGERNEIWPYALVEHPVSAFRMARKIYEGKFSANDYIVADLALTGIGGWTLRPNSPGTWGFLSERMYSEESDLLWEKPLVFSFQEVEADDSCAFRLIERVYEAFGLRRDAIPQEFDRQTGRLILPE